MDKLSEDKKDQSADVTKTAEKTQELSEGKKVMEDGELHEDEQGSVKGDDEDIPDDFFDDFSNQDFMDGLDIVDAWDEKEKNKQMQDHEKNGKNKKKEKMKSRERKSDEKIRSAERDKRKRSEERRRRSREKKTKVDLPRKKSNPDEADLRRDPDKTKRDLQKDRESYVKKKEQKLISKVVETGLVPPGMETEVSLSEIESKTENVADMKTKEKSRKESPKREAVLPNHEKKSREWSRERRRRRSRSFERPSPTFRGRSRERSIDRRRERRERSRERGRPQRLGSRERSSGRPHGVNAFSPPAHWRRRSRSISDRERWLHARRSSSPEKKYRGRVGEEKMSFLEELKMKLDGYPPSNAPIAYPHSHIPVQQNYVPPGPNLYPVQIPIVPSIQNQYYSPSQNSPYDQNFFIGDPKPVPTMNHPSLNGLQQINLQGTQQIGLSPIPGVISPMTDYPNVPQQIGQTVGPVPPPNSTLLSSASSVGVNHVSKLMEQIRAATNTKVNQIGTAAQLLDDKKLSLTDFLSINSRPAAFSSSTPDALQKKVSVLSRCQDVLKELTGDKKFIGKLNVTKTRKSLSKNEVKNISPLLRKEPVKFSFSTPLKDSEKPSFHSILNKALIKAKVISEVIDLDECENSIDGDLLPPPPIIGKQMQPFTSSGRYAEAPTMKNMLMKMCQTDPVHCEDCDRRNAVQTRSIGIQCGESGRYNVGVQVVEADIINSKIAKNQSLAYLTPAQLLGRSEPTSTKIDHFGNPYGRPQSFHDPHDYREWTRNSNENDPRRDDYINSPYSSGVMRDRFPRY